MADQSQMQGVVVLTAVEGLTELLAPDQLRRTAEVVDRMRGAGTWDRLAKMRRLSWVALEDYIAVVDASWEVLGEAAYLEFWGKMGSRYLSGPFAAIIKGFQSAFGITPPAVMRAMGVMWSMGTRHGGTITYEAGAHQHEGRMLFEAPAPLLSPVFLAGFCRGLHFIFELTKTDGSLTPKPVREGCVALEARWKPRAA